MSTGYWRQLLLHIQTSESQSGQFWLDFFKLKHTCDITCSVAFCCQQIWRIISAFGYLALWKVLKLIQLDNQREKPTLRKRFQARVLAHWWSGGDDRRNTSTKKSQTNQQLTENREIDLWELKHTMPHTVYQWIILKRKAI